MTVSDHAITRFRERSGCRKNAEYIRKRLLELIKAAKPARFSKPAHATFALLNHGFERADYLISQDGMVFVVVRDCIMTVHKNESKRWVVDE